MSDPRQRYRVELDRALERGEGEKAWATYQRQAELCLRPCEEWAIDRVPGFNDQQQAAHVELAAHRSIVLRGWGRRSGKTYFACRELRDAATARPDGRFLIVSSTSHHSDAAWQLLRQLEPRTSIADAPVRRMTLKNGSTIEAMIPRQVRSRVVGRKFDGVAIDEEPELARSDAYDVVATTMHGPGLLIRVGDGAGGAWQRPGWARISFAELERFGPGDYVTVDGTQINGESLRRLMRSWPDMVRFFDAIGYEVEQVPNLHAIDIRRRPGRLDENERANAIARAHQMLELEVTAQSWRIAERYYADPERRTALQLAWALTQWMYDPREPEFREAAARERADRARLADHQRVALARAPRFGVG